ncbi:MAG: hypothetical protein IT170_02305 [Bryobacterales bacterium]|nr:hypothetical protein [Bryobacterales bacterium]
MRPVNSNRLFIAILLYGVLAASSFFTLSGDIRIVVLIFFVGLTLKTWLAQEREKLYASEEAERGESREEP